VYALVNAHGLIAMGARKVLVIGTDTLSRIPDWTDRGTAILFADGSGACVLEAVDGPGQLLAWDLDSDGSVEDLLYAEIGGLLQMDGKGVFRRAVRIMVDSAEKSMAIAGVTADQLALVVPHQANTLQHANDLVSLWKRLPSCCTKRATHLLHRFLSPSLMLPTKVA
jgi:3-oxoacyl-[acyl-carrier-protein] synthase-3